MIKTLLCSSALLLAAPAIAQQAVEPQAPAQAAPQNQATPASDVASIVDSEFPAYDTNQSGQLEQAEFTKWMVALKDQEMKATGKSVPPAEVTAWASGAFATADKDKSTAVSKQELVSYLTGAA